jgi:hypothetical protein
MHGSEMSRAVWAVPFVYRILLTLPPRLPSAPASRAGNG